MQRAALLIALDPGVHSGSAIQLFSRYLQHCGFTMVTVMSASSKPKELRPTREHILAAVEKMVSMLKQTGVLLVYILGKGGHIQTGEEQFLPALLPLGCTSEDQSGALFIMDLQDALCSESEDDEQQPKVFLVLDVESPEPLWDDEQVTTFITDIPEIAWLCHTHPRGPSDPLPLHFLYAFISGIQRLLGTPTSATHKDLCGAVQAELSCPAGSLQAAAGSLFDALPLMDGTEVPAYAFILVCSVPVALTKQKDYQEQMAADLREALGCASTEGFTVMLDVIVSLKPLEEIRATALMPCVQNLAHHCRELGLEVPELKKVRLPTEDILSVPNSTALIKPEETADLIFSLTVSSGDTLRDKLLLKGSRVWPKVFSGFTVVEVRTTFQVRAGGLLSTYIKALSHLMAATPVGRTRIEALWVTAEPSPPAGALGTRLPPPEWLADEKPMLKVLTLSTSSHSYNDDDEPLVENESFDVPSLNGDPQPAEVGAALPDGAVVFRAGGHSYWVSCADFSADDQWLATGGWDCAIRVWNVTAGSLSTTFERAHGSWVTSLCFGRPPRKKSILRQRLISTCRGVPTESFITRIMSEKEKDDAGLSPSGSQKGGSAVECLLASGAMDGSVVIWNTEAGAAVHRLQAHDRGVVAVAFSRSSVLLATACEDGTVRCWAVATGACLGDLKGHRGCVSSLAFGSQREDFLVTASFDRTIFLWTLTGEDSPAPKTSRAAAAMADVVPPLPLAEQPGSNTTSPQRQTSKGMDRAFSWVTDAAMRTQSQFDFPANVPADLSESRIQ
eukprot:EG_transcript_3625